MRARQRPYERERSWPCHDSDVDVMSKDVEAFPTRLRRARWYVGQDAGQVRSQETARSFGDAGVAPPSWWS